MSSEIILKPRAEAKGEAGGIEAGREEGKFVIGFNSFRVDERAGPVSQGNPLRGQLWAG